MTFEWVKNRMAEVVEDDWRSRGEKVFAQGQPARFDADTVGYHVSTLFEWVM
jgi:hypothetical protein